MTDAPLTPHEAEDALAAEYVLGVLDLAERAEAGARLKRDPAFAARVAEWEGRLTGLNDGFQPAPAPNLLPQIEARLFPRAPGRSRSGLLAWLSGATVAAALSLAVVSTFAPPRPELVATLATADNRLAYRITHFGETLQITRMAGVAAVPGQVHELWLIAPDSAPVSLGLLQDRPLIITHPTPPAGFTFAVSIEPEGGSPTGQPTGPVILTATVGSA
ncbi:anti-sigma factor [Tabrizicola sp.]|uniref:anti-sigma factor n=1 Tax=Tabrizicola sp. TaxID=2005166 RepID=UPI002FDC99B6